VKDSSIELFAILSIIFGLLLGYFFIFDYAPKDAFFLEAPDNNAYLTGKVLNLSETASGQTRIQIESCRIFNAYYSGQIPDQTSMSSSNLTIYGSFSDGVLFVDSFNR
jgi:hypothetical protein